MKNIFIIILLAIGSLLSAQNYTKIGIGYAGVFIGGCLDGLNQTLRHHYYQFEKRYPDANPNYWNPSKSWLTKWELGQDGKPLFSENYIKGWVKNGDGYYKERFWGSSRWFVKYTDAYHLTQSLDATITIPAAVLVGSDNLNWKRIIIHSIGLSITRSLGQWVVHDIYFNVKI